jgi:hypothetical protein
VRALHPARVEKHDYGRLCRRLMQRHTRTGLGLPISAAGQLGREKTLLIINHNCKKAGINPAFFVAGRRMVRVAPYLTIYIGYC